MALSICRLTLANMYYERPAFLLNQKKLEIQKLIS